MDHTHSILSIPCNSIGHFTLGPAVKQLPSRELKNSAHACIKPFNSAGHSAGRQSKSISVLSSWKGTVQPANLAQRRSRLAFRPLARAARGFSVHVAWQHHSPAHVHPWLALNSSSAPRSKELKLRLRLLREEPLHTDKHKRRTRGQSGLKPAMMRIPWSQLGVQQKSPGK